MTIFENSHKALEIEDARIWKLNSDIDIKSFYNMVKEKAANQSAYRYFIEDPKGTFLCIQLYSLSIQMHF
jgi:hypothetical protein